MVFVLWATAGLRLSGCIRGAGGVIKRLLWAAAFFVLAGGQTTLTCGPQSTPLATLSSYRPPAPGGLVTLTLEGGSGGGGKGTGGGFWTGGGKGR